MAERVVTFEKASPVAGGSLVTEVQLEDDDGNRYLLRVNDPQTVPESVAKQADDLEHHSFKIETTAAHEKAQGGDEESG